jgi:glucose-6-phosphate 1-epimerase
MGAEGTTSDLNRRFGIPGIAEVVAGNGGLPNVRITCPAARGEMYLHGAHVTSWKPSGEEEVLFVSRKSRWEDGRAIRGGVPICFPWFGDKAGDRDAGAHGFVRAKAWQLEAIVQAGDAVAVSMFTESDASTKRWWPADFRLVHRATFGSELSQELLVTNTGAKPLRFEEALHTYYRVGQIETARLQGLDAAQYRDKTDGNQEKMQHGKIVLASETDSIYLNTRQAVELEDPGLHRCSRISKENSLTTVVWNPWVTKAQAMSDLGDDEWTQMICIEVCNVSEFAVDLPPGKQHTMKATVKVADF